MSGHAQRTEQPTPGRKPPASQSTKPRAVHKPGRLYTTVDEDLMELDARGCLRDGQLAFMLRIYRGGYLSQDFVEEEFRAQWDSSALIVTPKGGTDSPEVGRRYGRGQFNTMLLDMGRELRDGKPIARRNKDAEPIFFYERLANGKIQFTTNREQWAKVKPWTERDLAAANKEASDKSRAKRAGEPSSTLGPQLVENNQNEENERHCAVSETQPAQLEPPRCPTLAEVKARLQPLVKHLTSGREKISDADVLKLRKKLPPASALDVLVELIEKKKPNAANPHTFGLVLNHMADEAIAVAIEREEEEAKAMLDRLSVETERQKREAAWTEEEAPEQVRKAESRFDKGVRLLRQLTPEQLKQRKTQFAAYLKADSTAGYQHHMATGEIRAAMRDAWIMERLLEQLEAIQ